MGQDDVSLQTLREVNQLELLAEQHLRAQGLSAGCSVSAADDYSGTSNAGGLSGQNRSMLKGTKSGLDLVKHDCVVVNAQRCPHTHLNMNMQLPASNTETCL